MDLKSMYIDLLKDRLTEFYEKEYNYYLPSTAIHLTNEQLSECKIQYGEGNYQICKEHRYDPLKRAQGKDWPERGETMIGLLRLNNLEKLMKSINEKGVAGDFFEAGVWRGGASIFMNAMNKIYFNSERKVWLADSFQGLPASSHEADLAYDFTQYELLAVSLEEVKNNFKRYNLLDDHLEFVKGWFCDTLPNVKVEKISLLRLDGDLYESTMDILKNLYHKVEVGGYIVVDDYYLDCCQKAISDFWNENNINAKLIRIDWTGVYWEKTE